MRSRLFFLAPVAVFLVIAGYMAWGLMDPERNPSAVPSARVDQPVPLFAVPALYDSEPDGLATADLTNGKVTLVNFFASWCVPCQVEHPLFMQLAAQGKVELVGIAYRDKRADTRNWLKALGNPYSKIGVDQNGRTAIEWGVSGVPETFVIDREGRIRYQHIGPIHERDLTGKILPLIEELGG
ncbi:MAG: DsbE family thiol:disulfide interchange protein [Pseudomonadota bacterium]